MGTVPKLTAPGLGFDLRGEFGGVAVYQRRRGANLARTQRPPAQPRTASQIAQRAVFSWLQAAWKAAPSGYQTAWEWAVYRRPETARGAWTGPNVMALKSSGDLSGLTFMRSSRGAPSVQNVSTVSYLHTIEVLGVAPAMPSPWNFDSVHVYLLENVDPRTAGAPVWYTAASLSANFDIFAGGLDSATSYVLGVVALYSRGTGSLVSNLAAGGFGALVVSTA